MAGTAPVLHAEYLLSERSQHGAGTEHGPLTSAFRARRAQSSCHASLPGPTPVEIPAESPAASWQHPSRPLAALGEELQRRTGVPGARRARTSSMRTSKAVVLAGTAGQESAAGECRVVNQEVSLTRTVICCKIREEIPYTF